MLREVFAITDREHWPELIRAARAQRPAWSWPVLIEATGYSKTHLWRLATRRCR